MRNQQCKDCNTTPKPPGRTPELIKRDAKAPRARTKGAEARGLALVSLAARQAMHDACPSSHTRTVLECVSSLLALYMITSVTPFDTELVVASCRKCCILCMHLPLCNSD